MHALAYSARALRIAALCYLACEASSAAASESATFETVVRGEQRSAAPLSFSLSSDDAHHVPGGFGDALRAV